MNNNGTLASLTLKGVPDKIIERLRLLAEQERRSLNQQTILILEQALSQNRPDFKDSYRTFKTKSGESPLNDQFFSGLRSKEPGRDVSLET